MNCMNCLTCRSLIVDDWSENRVLRCGHDSASELDSNAAAPVIVYLEFDSDAFIVTPDWCHRRPYGIVQQSLFG